MAPPLLPMKLKPQTKRIFETFSLFSLDLSFSFPLFLSLLSLSFLLLSSFFPFFLFLLSLAFLFFLSLLFLLSVAFPFFRSLLFLLSVSFLFFLSRPLWRMKNSSAAALSSEARLSFLSVSFFLASATLLLNSSSLLLLSCSTSSPSTVSVPYLFAAPLHPKSPSAYSASGKCGCVPHFLSPNPL